MTTLLESVGGVGVGVGRRLVVNADDFGLSDGVNQGILHAHLEGIVTSTSLMVHGEAAREAVDAAAKHPGLEPGLHVDLAEWVCRDLERSQAYAIVDTSDAAAVAAGSNGSLSGSKLTGKRPTHLDSHQHVHREEPTRSIMGRRAKEPRCRSDTTGACATAGRSTAMDTPRRRCPGRSGPSARSA